MKLEVETPALLVDVRDLGTEIEETADGGLRIGAGVTNSALAADRRVRERYPLLAQAVLAGASGQLRNVATVGGNLLQRTRCAYFQDVTKPCNKRRPGSGCPAREGDHRNLAVLGHSEACVATHPSDMAVALAALGATVHVTGPARRALDPDPRPAPAARRRAAARHGARAGRADRRDRAATPPVAAGRARYRKVRDRASYAFAVVSVAVAVELDGGTVRDCRIAFGGLAHAVARRPRRGRAARRDRRRGRVPRGRRRRAGRRPSRCATTRSRCRWPATCSSRPWRRCARDRARAPARRRHAARPPRGTREGDGPRPLRLRAPRRGHDLLPARAGDDRHGRGARRGRRRGARARRRARRDLGGERARARRLGRRRARALPVARRRLPRPDRRRGRRGVAPRPRARPPGS